MTNILFRASSVGRLMSDPLSVDDHLRTPEIEEIIKKKTRTDPERAVLATAKLRSLSEAAKTYIRQLASEAIYGVDFEVSSKQMEKGLECEDASIALFNRVYGRDLKKNTERRSDEFFSGESDMPDVDEVVDVKTAWSVATMPLSEEDIADTQRKLYEFQLRTYCRLWQKPRGRLAYCLVDTPDHLIGYEPLQLHVVRHIPEHLRVTTWLVERDMEIEARMIEKVKAARRYYAEVIAAFDTNHQPPPESSR